MSSTAVAFAQLARVVGLHVDAFSQRITLQASRFRGTNSGVHQAEGGEAAATAAVAAAAFGIEVKVGKWWPQSRRGSFLNGSDVPGVPAAIRRRSARSQRAFSEAVRLLGLQGSYEEGWQHGSC